VAGPGPARGPTYEGRLELPVIGTATTPNAALIRPDGYVAWVAEADTGEAGLPDALSRWFGPPTPA
jgi:hypothetical protein